FMFIECPRQILPYARRVISDVTRDGGYPPLMLDNIDFAALYRQKLEEMRAQQGNAPTNWARAAPLRPRRLAVAGRERLPVRRRRGVAAERPDHIVEDRLQQPVSARRVAARRRRCQN